MLRLPILPVLMDAVRSLHPSDSTAKFSPSTVFAAASAYVFLQQQGPERVTMDPCLGPARHQGTRIKGSPGVALNRDPVEAPVPSRAAGCATADSSARHAPGTDTRAPTRGGNMPPRSSSPAIGLGVEGGLALEEEAGHVQGFDKENFQGQSASFLHEVKRIARTVDVETPVSNRVVSSMLMAGWAMEAAAPGQGPLVDSALVEQMWDQLLEEHREFCVCDREQLHVYNMERFNESVELVPELINVSRRLWVEGKAEVLAPSAVHTTTGKSIALLLCEPMMDLPLEPQSLSATTYINTLALEYKGYQVVWVPKTLVRDSANEHDLAAKLRDLVAREVQQRQPAFKLLRKHAAEQQTNMQVQQLR